jgi:hypothetical protein
MFTPEGDIREEYRDVISPSTEAPKPQKTEPAKAPAGPEKPATERRAQDAAADRRAGSAGDRRRTMADTGSNPGTAFTSFLEPLIAQAYMSLGMLPNPYQPQTKTDVGAARQMIDILTLLQEKTRGNLTPDEDDFLNTYLGELKLAFVKITKNLA